MNDEHKTRILVEDIESEGQSKELSGHVDIITALVYDHRNKKLYSTGKDKSLIKWNVADLFSDEDKEKKKNYLEKQHTKLHSGDIFTLEASSDFQFLMSGGKDKELKLVKAEDLTVLGSFDTKMAIYGIIEYKHTVFYYGKNSRIIGQWNIQKYAKVPSITQSPKLSLARQKRALGITTKSCALDSENIAIDKFFNKSSSLNNSK